MHLGTELMQGHKEPPALLVIKPHTLSHWPPPTFPHFLLTSLSSLFGCHSGLPWLTDNKRHKNPLIPPSFFSPLKWVTSLAALGSLELCQEIPCYLLPVFTPQEGSLGRHFRQTHTATLTTRNPTTQERDKNPNTHTSWPDLEHPTGPRTHSP